MSGKPLDKSHKNKKAKASKFLNYLMPSLSFGIAGAGIGLVIAAPIIQISEDNKPIDFIINQKIYMCNKNNKTFSLNFDLSKLPLNKLLNIQINNSASQNRVLFLSKEDKTTINLESKNLKLDFVVDSFDYGSSFVLPFSLSFSYINTNKKETTTLVNNLICSYGDPITIGSIELEHTTELSYSGLALINIDLQSKISSVDNVNTKIAEFTLTEQPKVIESISNTKITYNETLKNYVLTFDVVSKKELSEDVWFTFTFSPVKSEKYWITFTTPPVISKVI